MAVLVGPPPAGALVGVGVGVGLAGVGVGVGVGVGDPPAGVGVGVGVGVDGTAWTVNEARQLGAISWAGTRLGAVGETA